MGSCQSALPWAEREYWYQNMDNEKGFTMTFSLEGANLVHESKFSHANETHLRVRSLEGISSAAQLVARLFREGILFHTPLTNCYGERCFLFFLGSSLKAPCTHHGRQGSRWSL